MPPTDPDSPLRAPWRVALDFTGGVTRFEIEHHVAPAVVLDRRYWTDPDAAPTDAFFNLVHDERADVSAHRVRIGWLIAAAPYMRAALRDLLAADTREKMAAAREKALDALALAALPVGEPKPPAGYRVEAVRLSPCDDSIDPASIPATHALAELVACMAEFGPRRFELFALALARPGAIGGRDLECRWDPEAGTWTRWDVVRQAHALENR